MLHLGLKIQPIVYRFLSNIARVYIDVRDFYIQYYISTYTQVSTTHYSKRWFATVVRTAAAVHYVHRYYTQVAVRIPHRPSVCLFYRYVSLQSSRNSQSVQQLHPVFAIKGCYTYSQPEPCSFSVIYLPNYRFAISPQLIRVTTLTQHHLLHSVYRLVM